MFHTKEELETARELLNGFEKGKLDRTVVTDEALWAARQGTTLQQEFQIIFMIINCHSIG